MNIWNPRENPAIGEIIEIKKIPVEESCLTCDKKFNWQEEIAIKSPEWANFCKNCHQKYKDENVYDFSRTGEWWLYVWYPWKKCFITIQKKWYR